MSTKSTSPRIRKPYDRSPSTITFPETTMTKQSFQAECDINTIMDKYKVTGLVQHVQAVQGSYGDFTSVQDYQLTLNQVIAAQEAFDQLPSKIRLRFNNDPAHLMAFLSDQDNQEEAIRLGLAERKPTPPKPEEKPGSASPTEKKSEPATPATPAQ